MQEIIQGDARQVLKTIPDKSCHLVVTSPPYNVGIDFGIYKDNLAKEEYLEFSASWLIECFRILVDGGRICLNIPFYNLRGKFNMYTAYHELMTQIGFLDRDTFVWVKMDGLDFAHTSKIYGRIGPRNPHTKYPCELVLIMQKGSEILEGEKSDINFREFFKWSHSIWFIRPEYHREHPTPYPEELARRLIKMYSFVGQRVLDPFLGSGTTLKACERLKRYGIGIELDPKFVEMTKNSLDQFAQKGETR